MTFDSKFDLLEAALAQNKLGDIAVLDVTEEPVQWSRNNCLRVFLAHLRREIFIPKSQTI